MLFRSVGAASGWLQQMRGAHFLTHTLWSMWISCAIVLGVTLALQRHAARSAGGVRQRGLTYCGRR